MRILLVASSGGHLAHLLALRPWWSEHSRVWVSFDTPDAVERLAGERVVWAHHPTNRRPDMLLKNAILAMRVLAEVRPDVVLSSGAGVALPFLAVARITGIPTVFLEVFDRIHAPSWTGRIAARWVDAVALQWEDQRAHYPRGTVVGRLF